MVEIRLLNRWSLFFCQEKHVKEEMEVLFFGVDQKYRLPCSDIQEWESGFLSVFAEKKEICFCNI